MQPSDFAIEIGPMCEQMVRIYNKIDSDFCNFFYLSSILFNELLKDLFMRMVATTHLSANRLCIL